MCAARSLTTEQHRRGLLQETSDSRSSIAIAKGFRYYARSHSETWNVFCCCCCTFRLSYRAALAFFSRNVDISVIYNWAIKYSFRAAQRAPIDTCARHTTMTMSTIKNLLNIYERFLVCGRQWESEWEARRWTRSWTENHGEIITIISQSQASFR